MVERLIAKAINRPIESVDAFCEAESGFAKQRLHIDEVDMAQGKDKDVKQVNKIKFQK